MRRRLNASGSLLKLAPLKARDSRVFVESSKAVTSMDVIGLLSREISRRFDGRLPLGTVPIKLS